MSDSAGWPTGVGHLALASVDSTNAEAFRRAAGLDRPTWISAARQTAGRGRQSRPWASPSGNLHATLVTRIEDPPQIVALRSFVAALALRDALASLVGKGPDLALKWPNDVLLNGGKVAGILLEAQAAAPGTLLAIGIGVNLDSHPDPAPGAAIHPVCVRSETDLSESPTAFLTRLAHAYATRDSLFRRAGFAAIRADWLAHAARLGQPIRARTGQQTRDGIFDTIDENGNLILVLPSGPVAIPAAEVFF